METDLDGETSMAGKFEVKKVGVHAANTGTTTRRSSVSCSVLVGIASDCTEIGNGEMSWQRGTA